MIGHHQYGIHIVHITNEKLYFKRNKMFFKEKMFMRPESGPTIIIRAWHQAKKSLHSNSKAFFLEIILYVLN